MKQVKENVLYGIYEENLLIYVGITKDFERRRLEHFRPSTWKSQHAKYLYRRMKKYGKENYHVAILAQSDSRTEICKMEKEYIKRYSPLTNLTVGGECVIIPREELKKMRIGKFNAFQECYRKDLLTGKIKRYDSINEARRENGFNNINILLKGSICNQRYIFSKTMSELAEVEKLAIERSRTVPIHVLDYYTLDILETVTVDDRANYDASKYKFCKYGKIQEFREEMKNQHFYYVYDSNTNTDKYFTKVVDIKKHLSISGNIVYRAIRSNNTTQKLRGVYIYQIPFGTPREEFVKVKKEDKKEKKPLSIIPIDRELSDLEIKLLLAGKISFN